MPSSQQNSPQIAFLCAALCIVIVGSGVDAFVPSLPFMMQDLQTTPASIRLIVSLYLLSYGVSQWFVGGLSDSLGRRWVLLPSLVGYLLATLVICLTQSIMVLLSMRVLQGVFAAGIGVVARALISDCYRGEALAKKATLLTFFWAIGPIFSPYLGGYLQHWFAWQAVFYCLATYTLLVTLVVFLLLVETVNEKQPLHISSMLQGYREILRHPLFMTAALICGLSYALITIYKCARAIYYRNDVALFSACLWLYRAWFRCGLAFG